MTNEERQALISHCKFMLSKHIKYGGYCYDEDIYRIALAALTAEPIAYFLLIDGGYLQLADEYRESPDAIPLYAAPSP